MVYALIVIYNKSIKESITYNCIKNFEKLNVIIFDNSERDYGNSSYAKENGIVYYTQNKNIGLSKAYNYVINKLNLSDNDYIIILDDDSEISTEYYNEAISVIKNNQYDIILPIVYSENQIISPSNVQFGCRVKLVKKISKIEFSRITAINSGMIVSARVYKNVRYDEELFLDYVDHTFMHEVRTKKYSISIMESRINQNYSRNQKQSIDSVKHRYKIFKKDFFVYCRKCRKVIFYFLSITKLQFKYLIKYKKII